MYKFPIGVMLQSFRCETKDALEQAARLGVQGIQLLATSGGYSPEELIGNKRSELMDMMNIDRALITCRENNIGSKKTMNKFLGEADSLVPSMYEGIMEYRYWIDVKENLKELENDKKINR